MLFSSNGVARNLVNYIFPSEYKVLSTVDLLLILLLSYNTLERDEVP